MAASEFSLIQTYFAQLTRGRSDVIKGIGDDCALLRGHATELLAVSIDTLVEGVHFFADIEPFRLGYKSLAVGLSDLAAMGAEPAWFTLALTLPENNAAWLESFASGLAELALQHNVQLVGGDTTRGPLTISIQVHGHVPETSALRRDTARVGDKICVTGTLGDAGAALNSRLTGLNLQGLTAEQHDYLWSRLELPTPRNTIGKMLRQCAHAAIDISDGLLADLGHVLAASHVGAVLNVDSLPMSEALLQLPRSIATELALTAGDDYELCFTAPANKLRQLLEADVEVTCIGEVTTVPELVLVDHAGRVFETPQTGMGYDHFKQ